MNWSAVLVKGLTLYNEDYQEYAWHLVMTERKKISFWQRELNKSEQILGGKIKEHVFSDVLKSNLFSKIHPVIRH